MADLELVIFDCDGVLVDSEPLAALAYTRVYGKYGLPITTDVITRCVGMKQADIIAKIEDITGHRLPEEATHDLWPEIKQLFAERLTPTNGLKPFLDRFDLSRCVASSSSMERIQFSLEKADLAHFFGPSVFSSTMVKRGKPAPDIFLFAADKMNKDPASCIVIEDSPLGTEGAVAAGMTAIGYIGGGHTYSDHGARLFAAGATAVCDDWKEIESLLAGWRTSGGDRTVPSKERSQP